MEGVLINVTISNHSQATRDIHTKLLPLSAFNHSRHSFRSPLLSAGLWVSKPEDNRIRDLYWWAKSAQNQGVVPVLESAAWRDDIAIGVPSICVKYMPSMRPPLFCNKESSIWLKTYSHLSISNKQMYFYLPLPESYS